MLSASQAGGEVLASLWLMAGWILLGAAGLAVLVLAVAVVRIMRSVPFPPSLAFWWALSALYCRWWFRLRRIGPCTVPAEGPVIVAANHTCAIDPLLVIACIPHRLPAYIVAQEYANPPLIGRVLRRAECIPVRRDGADTAATRAALRHLKAGKVLGIFIEGRIAQPGESLEAKDGAAMLALHSGAKVVPVHISGTRWDENILWAFIRRHRARVRFGDPIDLHAEAAGRPDKSEVPRISAMLLERIRALAPAGGPPPDTGIAGE